MRSMLLVVGVAIAGGCDKPRIQPVINPPVVVASDSIRIGELYKPLPGDEPDFDRLRVLIDSLENQLPGADSIRRPILLLAIGRAKSLYEPPRGSAHESFAVSRPDEYWYNEVGGDYLYRGKDLQTLVDSFPTHQFVDDAAYEITTLSRGGECEGYIDCYAGWSWEKIKPFIVKYPTSPLVAAALDRFFDNYELALEQVEDLGLPTEYFTPTSVKAILHSADSTIAKLPGNVRAPAQVRSQAIWKRFADAEAASGYTTTPVPEEAPDTLPSWVTAEENRGTAPIPCTLGNYVKDMIAVAFTEHINVDYRQQNIDEVRGNVVGGSVGADGRRYYWIKLFTGKGALSICDAVAYLEPRNGHIERVTAIPFGGKP